MLALPEVHAASLRAEILAHDARVGAVPTPQGLAKLDAGLARVPLSIQAPTADILAAMNAATDLRQDAFARVLPSELAWAYVRGQDPTPMTLAEQAKAASIVSRIDISKMDLAARLVTTAIERDSPILRAHATQAVAFVDPLGAVELATSTNDVHDADRTLLIDFGGDDTWSNNAGAAMPDYIIDAIPGCITTGGLDCTVLDAKRNTDVTRDLFGRACSFGVDDLAFNAVADEQEAQAFALGQVDAPSTPQARAYEEHATATYPTGATGALAANTNCLPQSPTDATGDWFAGFTTRGFLTNSDAHLVAVGLDLGGNDIYAPPREFNNINNGGNAAGCDTTGMGDAGKIWARNLTAGGAFAGVGVLWDTDGSDAYGGRSIVQGAGHVGGVGVLVDDGAGDNTFSAVRLGQGVGFFAGLGLLDVRGGGNDQYRLENDVPFFNEFEHFIGCDVSTRDGQGRGNFNGVGALIDAAGNDDYFVQSHDLSIPGAVRDDPTTTQGSGGDRLQIGAADLGVVFTQAIGVLDDQGGHDSYTRAGRADGMTSNDAHSVFMDDGAWPPSPAEPAGYVPYYFGADGAVGARDDRVYHSSPGYADTDTRTYRPLFEDDQPYFTQTEGFASGAMLRLNDPVLVTLADRHATEAANYATRIVIQVLDAVGRVTNTLTDVTVHRFVNGKDDVPDAGWTTLVVPLSAGGLATNGDLAFVPASSHLRLLVWQTSDGTPETLISRANGFRPASGLNDAQCYGQTLAGNVPQAGTCQYGNIGGFQNQTQNATGVRPEPCGQVGPTSTSVECKFYNTTPVTRPGSSVYGAIAGLDANHEQVPFASGYFRLGAPDVPSRWSIPLV